jgi:hypothetical protein
MGLLRLLDRRGRCHRYAIATVPPRAGVERVGELGALLRERPEGGIPVWLTADGRLCTDRYEPSMPDLDARVLTRWTLAPIRWLEVATLVERMREVLRRGIDVASALRRASTSEGGTEGARCGYLLASGGDGRLALFSSIHPVSGDQLLSTDQDESTQLGYNAPMLLGFVVAEAPASGVLGLSRPLVPWASRFGR